MKVDVKEVSLNDRTSLLEAAKVDSAYDLGHLRVDVLLINETTKILVSTTNESSVLISPTPS